MWHTSHSHGDGSYLAILTGFLAKNEACEPKTKIFFVKKWAKKAKKAFQKLLMATMVALAAPRKVKMALMLGRLFEILTSVDWIFDFLLFYCYNKTTSKLF